MWAMWPMGQLLRLNEGGQNFYFFSEETIGIQSEENIDFDVNECTSSQSIGMKFAFYMLTWAF